LKWAKTRERMWNEHADFRSILDKDGNVLKTYFQSNGWDIEWVDHRMLKEMTVSFEWTATDDYVLSRMFMAQDT
jgi:hypothetical protein